MGTSFIPFKKNLFPIAILEAWWQAVRKLTCWNERCGRTMHDWCCHTYGAKGVYRILS